LAVNPDGSVTEFTAGVTPGFTANGRPDGITAGPDGNIWFTEFGVVCGEAANCAGQPPGAVARLNADGSVTEFTGGVTPGFGSQGGPSGITTGPDGNIWFTEAPDLGGAVARLNANGSVTQFVVPGFIASGGPDGITTGPDGNIWFTDLGVLGPGGVGRVNPDGSVTEFKAGVTPGFTAGRGPAGITTGPDGNIWFTESWDPGVTGGFSPNPGAVGRMNLDGSVTEFTGGVTSGFTAHRSPYGITTGPDGNVWFTESANPGAVGRITFTTPAGPGGGVGPTPPVPPILSPAGPSLSQVAQSHRRWREGNGLAQIARVQKPPIGTAFRFTLNESATVRFAFTQQLPGRKLRGGCVARRSKNLGKPACARTVTVGAFSFTAGAGAHKVRFQGRTSKNNKLKPGSYTLIITATNAAGQHATARLTFTIVT
jgi:streptogramin lyase